MRSDYETILSGVKIETLRGRMCANTSINFLGSLMLQDEVDEFHREHPVSEHLLPRKFENAAQVVSSIPLFTYDKATGKYTQVARQDGSPIVAPSVLVKQACGEVVGVVLTGELAGLVLEVKGSMPNEGIELDQLQEGMVVSRLWNEEPIRETDVPYAPTTVFSRPPSVESFEFVDDLLHNFQKRFRNKAPSLLTQTREGQRFDRSTSLLFRFLEKRGIPFDRDSFKTQLPTDPRDAEWVK